MSNRFAKSCASKRLYSVPKRLAASLAESTKEMIRILSELLDCEG